MLGSGADSISVLDAVSSTVRDAIDGVAGGKMKFLLIESTVQVQNASLSV